MAEYIEREALIKALESDFNTDWADYASKDYIDGVRDEYDDVLKIICTMPAADVQPIRHGHWIHVESYRDCEGDFYSKYKCSCCGFILGGVYDNSDLMNFCGGCGADMREEK